MFASNTYTSTSFCCQLVVVVCSRMLMLCSAPPYTGDEAPASVFVVSSVYLLSTDPNRRTSHLLHRTSSVPPVPYCSFRILTYIPALPTLPFSFSRTNQEEMYAETCTRWAACTPPLQGCLSRFSRILLPKNGVVCAHDSCICRRLSYWQQQQQKSRCHYLFGRGATDV